jgi:hypothetical protein
VDIRQHSTPSDRRLDHGVQLFVTPDGQLQVSRGDPLDSEIFGGVTYHTVNRDPTSVSDIDAIQVKAFDNRPEIPKGRGGEQRLTSKLQNLGCQILQNRSHVDRRFGSHSNLVLGRFLEETVDTTYGELLSELIEREEQKKIMKTQIQL